MFFLKPVNSNWTVYVPGTTSTKEKSPLSLVLASRLMPVASLSRVILAPARTAPVGSATRPTMRPLAPWATSNVGTRRERARMMQTALQRARGDGMEPPASRGEDFSLKATACVRQQPCYNPARLEKGRRTVKEKNAFPRHKTLIRRFG